MKNTSQKCCGACLKKDLKNTQPCHSYAGAELHNANKMVDSLDETSLTNIRS